eukprot:1801206-Pyramimonas_sp.AAC.1
MKLQHAALHALPDAPGAPKGLCKRSRHVPRRPQAFPSAPGRSQALPGAPKRPSAPKRFQAFPSAPG